MIEQITEQITEPIIIADLQQMEQFAQRLAKQLTPGTIYLFNGDLGAGKTQCIKYILAYMGITEAITSPTFSLVQAYNAHIFCHSDICHFNIWHSDVYRLDNFAQVENLCLGQSSDIVYLVEWGQRFSQQQWHSLGAAVVNIDITVNADDTRSVRVS